MTRHEKWNLQPSFCAMALSICVFFPVAGCALQPVAAENGKEQDAAAHDTACIFSLTDSAISPDEKARYTAFITFAYYLGRLDQMGFTPEQIQSRVEKFALSPDGKKPPRKILLKAAREM